MIFLAAYFSCKMESFGKLRMECGFAVPQNASTCDLKDGWGVRVGFDMLFT